MDHAFQNVYIPPILMSQRRWDATKKMAKSVHLAYLYDGMRPIEAMGVRKEDIGAWNNAFKVSGALSWKLAVFQLSDCKMYMTPYKDGSGCYCCYDPPQHNWLERMFKERFGRYPSQPVHQTSLEEISPLRVLGDLNWKLQG